MSANKDAQRALDAVLGCRHKRTIAATMDEARELLELLGIPPHRLAECSTRSELLSDLSDRAAIDIELGETVRSCAPGLADWAHLEARMWRAGLLEEHGDAWEALDALLDRAVDVVQRRQFGA